MLFSSFKGQSDNKTTDKFVSYLFLYKEQNIFRHCDMLLQNHKVKLHNHRQVFFPSEYSRRVTPIIFSDPKSANDYIS